MQKRRSHSRRVELSEEQSAKMHEFVEGCKTKGILQGSPEFLEGISKIMSTDRAPERVACPIGVKGISDHVYKPPGRVNEPWWLHILDDKHPMDMLRGFSAYEHELLINDLRKNAGVLLARPVPKDKPGRVALLQDMITAAVKRNRDVAKCTQYDQLASTWVPEEWCVNCGRECLKRKDSVIEVRRLHS